jgi:ribonucleoside-diphosphate reductase alpha chain
MIHHDSSPSDSTTSEVAAPSWPSFLLKRDGSPQEFREEALAKALDRAALSAPDLEDPKQGGRPHCVRDQLLPLLRQRVREGMSSSDLQQLMIQQALTLVSAQEPEWTRVAGNLSANDLRKRVVLTRGWSTTFDLRKSGVQKWSFGQHVREMIARGLYDPKVGEGYTDAELDALGAELLDDQHDLLWDYAGISMMARRYLIQYDGLPWETPQEAYLTLSLLLNINERPQRFDKIRATHRSLSLKLLSLATPILRNLRRPNGSLTSCFVLQMPDSRDGIFDALDKVARISKQGGGVGVDMTPVRAQGSAVNGVPGVSGGVAPWAKLLNGTAVAVNQGGARAGAVTVALRAWHADIQEFLELQTENGDQRRKAHDVHPQAVLPDEFLRRVRDQPGKIPNWTIVCPHEVQQVLDINLVDCWGAEFEQRYAAVEAAADKGLLKTARKINAKDLFRVMMKTLLETGHPYLMFIDTWNRMNPNQGDGMIPSVNLCVESVSNVKRTTLSDAGWKYDPATGKISVDADPGLVHCCNLMSLNLAAIEDEQELGRQVREAVRLLDNTIDLTVTPLPEAMLHNNRYRTVGLGVMGWADWLASRHIDYAAAAGVAEAHRVFELIAYHAFSESVELAAARGSFGAWEVSQLHKGLILGKTAQELESVTKMPAGSWTTLMARMQQVGCRNSQLLATAPTTSTALVLGATPSLLPPYGRVYLDKNGKQTVPVVPPHLRKGFWYYKEFKHIPQEAVVSMAAAAQQWIDTGISMELLFNLNDPTVTPARIYQNLMQAWEQGCKAVYYVRSIQKGSEDLQGVEAACVACAN